MLNLGFGERLKLLASSNYQFHFSTFCVLFLISFQEADLAALMQATGWTEWLFTKHVGGLALSETMRLSLWTILIQVPLLIPIVLWLNKDSSDQSVSEQNSSTCSIKVRTVGTIWVAIASLIVCIIPFVQIVRGTVVGVETLFEQPSTVRELGDGVLLATTTAAILLYCVVPLTVRIGNISNSSWRLGLLFLLLVPGTIGSLAMGVLISGIFQTPGFRLAYDTPIPLVIGELFIILPKAIILTHCLGRNRPLAGLHWITLLNASGSEAQRNAAKVLNWQLSGRRKFACVAIIWCWAYFEVMLPSILAMPGLAPIGLVLYNNLHYGRIAALGAKLALMVSIPVIAGGGFLLIRQRYVGRKNR